MRTNTGKKYIKLHGSEAPAGDNVKRAAEFMAWYADNMAHVRRCACGAGFPIDDDLLADTFVGIHEAILYRDALIVNYTAYFLRSYKARHLNNVQKKKHLEFSDMPERYDREAETKSYPAEYQKAIAEIDGEIMDYVRRNYDGMTAGLFEIYMRLYPDVSYKRLADLLGIPFIKVWTSIGKVRKNVDRIFRTRKNFLLSVVDF